MGKEIFVRNTNITISSDSTTNIARIQQREKVIDVKL